MEKYIRQCLESLMIKEVLDKIEILVVLDGSTDRSEEIAMEYAKAHPYSVRTLKSAPLPGCVRCGRISHMSAQDGC